jgi:hypothetical protein
MQKGEWQESRVKVNGRWVSWERYRRAVNFIHWCEWIGIVMIFLITLYFLFGCGGNGSDSIINSGSPGGSCCDNHGGFATCWAPLVLNSHGYLVWDNQNGKIHCNDGYVCPGIKCVAD